MAEDEHYVGDGPGKYDAECTAARKTASAAGAVLIIIGGDRGNGFSVQLPPAELLALPDRLETMAALIREQLLKP